MSSFGRAVLRFRSPISPLTAAVVTLALLGALLAGAGNAFHQPVHDLDTDPADLTVLGVNGSDQLGWIVASGDFNGDGIDDFLITARLADPLGRGNTGAAYVVFGPRTGTIDLAQCPGAPNHCADVVIQGADVNDHLGFSAAAANFNGDGYDDILVASWRGAGASNLKPLSGEAYVILGAPSLSGTVDTQAGQQDFTVYGASVNDQMGISSAAGDVNGDGYDDILLGSTSADPGGKSDAGEAYVVFGSAVLSGSVDLATATDTVIVQGDKAGDLLGGSVGAGDISGDGVADLLLGAHFADPKGRATAGIVYGLFDPQPGTIDLSNPSTTADLTVLGADAGDVVGLRASGVDFNGDGQDDLYLDARFGDGNGNAHVNAGEAYVIFGPRSGEIDLDTTTPDFTIFGADADDRLRSSLDAGDFNGDGIDDLAASSFFADGAGSGTACGLGQVGDSCEAGETYIVFGPRTGTLDLATASADHTVLGAQPGDNLGRWLSAGDFDGDGVDDLLTGSVGADPGGRTEAGEAYVLFAGNAPNTRAGSNVCVALNGGLGVVGGVRVCFSSVSSAGDTTVTISATGPPPPTGFRIVGLPGSPVVYYDIDTTAGFTAPVQVCIHYGQAQGQNEAHFKLQHRETGFKDATDQGYPDTANDVICGSTSSLSLFAITAPVAVGGTMELLTGAANAAQAAGGSARSYATPAVAAGVAVAIAVLGCAIREVRRRQLRREL